MHRAVPSQLGVRAGAEGGRHRGGVAQARGRLVQGHAAAHRPHRPLPRLLRAELPPAHLHVNRPPLFLDTFNNTTVVFYAG